MARAKVAPDSPLNTAALLELARAGAPKPDRLTEDNTGFWRVQASSNVLDFYSTIMDEATLKNFAADLITGVSYQDSHNAKQNGWGQSIDGQVTRNTAETVTETGEGLLTVEGTFYTLLGETVNGQSTTGFLNMIEGGVWRDVSVGFYASDIRCSICGNQSLDGWWKDDGCTHVPGLTYQIEGKKIENLAWARIMDGHLVEVSQVYDGATPGAAVLKAEQMNAEGRLTESDRAQLNRRLEVRMRAPDRTYALGDPTFTRGGSTATTNATAGADRQSTKRGHHMGELTQEQIEDLQARNDEYVSASRHIENVAPDDYVKLVDGQTLPTRVKALVTGVNSLRATLTQRDAEVARLTPLADDGKAYRADLIEEALGEGVRARGSDFKSETYKRNLEGMDIEGVKLMRDDFRAVGDKRLGVGKNDDPSAATSRRTSDAAEHAGNDEANDAPDDITHRRNRRAAR